MNQAIKQCKEDVKPEILDGFLKKLFYIPFNPNSEVDYEKLRSGIESISKKYDIIKNCIYYLATPPKMFVVIAENLGKKNMQDQSDGYKSLIVEKPFGSDLESARNLNKELRQVFKEEQIYRIDHYLGKETVQNVFVTRFSNGIFEPLWNRNFVSHIEVTAAENLGIENRGGYYDNAGALRDMVQNHLLQLVRLIAMEPPSSLDSNAIRNESLKVLQSLKKMMLRNML
jgi:glucose-6-phosphate 1-dehydrogenase